MASGRREIRQVLACYGASCLDGRALGFWESLTQLSAASGVPLSEIIFESRLERDYCDDPTLELTAYHMRYETEEEALARDLREQNCQEMAAQREIAECLRLAQKFGKIG